MKTAIQELIEMFESDFNIIQLKRKENDSVRLIVEASTLSHVITNLKIKLETERRQHETTFHRGINIGALNPELDIEGRKESAKHYYESAFVHLNNQNK